MATLQDYWEATKQGFKDLSVASFRETLEERSYEPIEFRNATAYDPGAPEWNQVVKDTTEAERIANIAADKTFPNISNKEAEIPEPDWIENEPDYAKLSADLDRSSEVTSSLGLDEEGRLHRDPREGPAQITVREQDWGHGDGSIDTTAIYADHGKIIATMVRHSSRDEEGRNLREEWFDYNGELHSFNGNPSRIVDINNYIPSESYLDEAGVEFHTHGQFIDARDSTFDDIVSHKGFSTETLNQFGWDPEPGHQPEPKPEYEDRFAHWPELGPEMQLTPGATALLQMTQRTLEDQQHREAPEHWESRHDEITRRLHEINPGPDIPYVPIKPTETPDYIETQRFYRDRSLDNAPELEKPDPRQMILQGITQADRDAARTMVVPTQMSTDLQQQQRLTEQAQPTVKATA